MTRMHPVLEGEEERNVNVTKDFWELEDKTNVLVIVFDGLLFNSYVHNICIIML